MAKGDKFVTEETCEKNAKTYFYSAARKAVLVNSEWVSIEKLLNRTMERGTAHADFKTFLNFPAFKKMWGELRSTLKEVVKEGDVVVRFHQKSGNGPKYPTIYTAGKVSSWVRTCEYRSKKVSYRCHREFVTETGGTTVLNECSVQPISALSEWKEGEAMIRKFKKDIKKSGFLGIVIAYRGRVYRI